LAVANWLSISAIQENCNQRYTQEAIAVNVIALECEEQGLAIKAE